MRRVVLFMHISLDGLVAGVNGENDRINVEGEMFDAAIQQTYKSDTAIYGRVTYQLMENHKLTAADKPGDSKHDGELSA